MDDPDYGFETVEEDQLTVDINENIQVKKRHFVVQAENVLDPLPQKYRHVRDSERKVKDSVYLAITDLIGIGLSVPEAQKAVLIVSNRLFDRSFKIASDSLGPKSSTIDLDTLHSERSIRKVVDQVEAHGLAAEAEEIV